MPKVSKGDIVEVVYDNNTVIAFLYVVLAVNKVKGVYCSNKHHTAWITTTGNSWNRMLGGGKIKKVAKAYDTSKKALISLSSKLSASGAE